MTNLSIIENRVSATEKYLRILEGYKKFSKEEIEKDINIRGATERYLYLVVQSTIDLADAVISYRNFRKPTTNREAFFILNEEEAISSDLTERLSDMAGFRNIIAHDYEDINYDIIYDILQNKLSNIQEFLKVIKEEVL
jgi:uncharacterized protein YutE (UPF0331/DUF86 family)